jgi:cobalt-precorrin 5A hydrolase
MEKQDKWAIVALSREGINTAHKIKEHFEVDIYTLEKYILMDEMSIKDGLKSFNGFLFKEYGTIIYIMATGIVVRDIAPYLKHKSLDPAVLVVDGKGNFVISLLSGHLGGANEKARAVAEKIGGQAVITTMSDVMGKTAVDTIALSLDCVIDSFEDAKRVTADIIDNKKIGIKIDALIKIENRSLPENVEIDDGKKDFHGRIIITNKKEIERTEKDAVLICKNIVLGVGCRKETSFEALEDFILERLKKYNINRKSVKELSSIDVKKDEAALVQFSKKYRTEFITFNSEEMIKYENNFEKSEFVKNTVGVTSVCEISGYMASNYGKQISAKESKEGITLSIWEEEKCYML